MQRWTKEKVKKRDTKEQRKNHKLTKKVIKGKNWRESDKRINFFIFII